MPDLLETNGYVPWVRWLEVAAERHLVIVDWPEEVPPPGPGFDSKKLCGPSVKKMVAAYIDNIVNQTPIKEGLLFSVEKWSDGMSIDFKYIKS